ncbi:MAG TPA: DnaJ domain-containing protein [Chitinophagaceae bacterium]|nr:DnaJ domain-containing protein [Chitinophagaceae bacterium]
MAKQDYYDILGVPRNASRQMIVSAYRKLRQQQDRKLLSKAIFAQVTEAYSVLSDPAKRKNYDSSLGAPVFFPGEQAQLPSRDWKKILLPHIVAILIFIALGVIYFSPVLQGKVLSQGDMTQVRGMTKEARDYFAQTGHHPLWSNSMFSGMPTYVTYTGPTSDLMVYVERIITLFLPSPLNMLFLAMLGFYVLMCVLDFRYWIRVFGAVAFGLSSFNIILIGAGHVTEIMTLAYVAPVLAGILVTYRGKFILGGAITLISAGLMVYSNHLQIMYYTLIIIACLVVAAAIRSYREGKIPQFFKASAVLAVVAILAILPSSDNLLVTKQFVRYSTRGSRSEITLQNQYNTSVANGGLDINYAYAWSMGKMESFSVLVPDIVGGPASSADFANSSELYKTLVAAGQQPEQAGNLSANIGSSFDYWGPQPGTTPVYFGAVICFLFILSFFLVRSWHRWWLLAATGIGFLLSWGKNFPVLNDFLFYHLPYYNKFRAPSMALIIPQLTFVILACWALQEILISVEKKQLPWKAVRKALLVTGTLLLVILSGVMGDFSSPRDPQLESMLGGNTPVVQQIMHALRTDRTTLLHADGLRSILLVLLATLLLWAFIKNKVGGKVFAGLISLLLLIDLIQVDKRYLNNDQFLDSDQQAGVFQPSQADQLIDQDPDPDYRVLNLSLGATGIFNDALTSYFHKSVGGYSPAKLWRYQDLIDFQLEPAIQHMLTILQGPGAKDSSTIGLFSSSPVLNLLNTKYFIINPAAAPVPNPAACGNAWFVKGIHWAADANSEILSLTDFNPLDSAIIDRRFAPELQGLEPAKDSGSYIHLTRYSLNDLYYASDNSQAGFGVFSEIYYPAGWKAYIDGQPSAIFRVDYALRGLRIPAGKHQVVFHFHPDVYFLGQRISFFSSLLLILLFAWGIFFSIRESGKVQGAGKDQPATGLPGSA